MGTQKPVVIGESPEEVVGGPIAEHHGKKKEQDKKKKVEEKIKEKKFEKDKTKVVEEVEKKEEVKIEEKAEEKEAPKKKVKVGKAKIRSKKYQKASTLIDRAKKYDIVEAFELVKKTSLTNFNGNVEVHLRLLSRTGKPENIRGMLKYPNSTGQSIKIVILDEKIASEIEKTLKADADIYIASPELMPKIAKLAKILGPKGKMPNPKSGTITENPEKTKKELEAGQAEYKSDSYGNIHQVIGKVSNDNKKLEENFRALLAVLPSDRITGISICATMGPGIKVQI